MKIKEILNQHRRDFIAVYECEHCDHETKMEGYDDRNFHDHVIPKMECCKCGKTSPDSYRGLHTKYPHDMLV